LRIFGKFWSLVREIGLSGFKNAVWIFQKKQLKAFLPFFVAGIARKKSVGN
jgi:hypothetical protein